MKKTLTAMTLLATAAFANNTNHLSEIVAHAQKVQFEAQQLSKDYKAGATNHDAIEKRTATVQEQIEQLKMLVAEYEAASPNLTAAQKQDWEMLKTKVELLQVFANNKKAALEKGNIAKNKSLLRAHADGIAKRAEMLQKTASKLN